MHRRQRLTWVQKAEIYDERMRHNINGSVSELKEIFEWATKKMKLHFAPYRITIQRIREKGESIKVLASRSREHQKQRTTVVSELLENCLSDWVYEKYNRRVCVTEDLICEKGGLVQVLSRAVAYCGNSTVRDRDALVLTWRVDCNTIHHTGWIRSFLNRHKAKARNFVRARPLGSTRPTAVLFLCWFFL